MSKSKFIPTQEEQHVELPLYDASYPHALRWRGSVLNRIALQIIGVMLWATLITLLADLVEERLFIATSVITLMGVVTSLLLVFRTNTAYDRFWEGRRIWSQAVQNIRILARHIWVMVPEARPEDLLEKQSVINLLTAFSISTKHYLRAEYGAEYRDLHQYVAHIPKYCTPTSIEPMADPTHDKRHRRRASLEAKHFPMNAASSNLPLEILVYINSYIRLLRKRNTIDPPVASTMENALVALTDCLTGFERILRTPIPLAYSIHLAQCIWIFCLALPFQLISGLGYITIPVTALVAFTFLGIKSIGEEIENPFGYDTNDLPLDEFCRVIRREVETITSQKAPKLETWALDAINPSHIPPHVSVHEEVRLAATTVLERQLTQSVQQGAPRA
ncbi:Bestrophin, RFP-TM, chloride channel-domain-containing protein [Thamnocephalis sphaerospora]|uniref:Bestrophin, RFP-TM, chloride channel-domain-containing protein n=1 Tax=Thamnocephalis sphaerospora TaxID=78915 RepID=A0A4V1IWB3_9FUNG|nr:Bestrophin, RFP-TM, chloride channel-domain-containing protein [Thamnocephalis sphaerospora]|eukprot:RKP06959.1 Bestrophin, RFP-TM, chloride channel-domain-containing protein [Thamnocephalis sphaerospora]